MRIMSYPQLAMDEGGPPMAKSGRGRAPRDRKRPYSFPKPPCTPSPPKPPEPVKPSGPGCETGPGLEEIRERVRRRKKR